MSAYWTYDEFSVGAPALAVQLDAQGEEEFRRTYAYDDVSRPAGSMVTFDGQDYRTQVS